jgi:hypothetical protein
MAAVSKRRQGYGIRRSNCSTTAIPALVTVAVTGFVEPSVAGTSTPLDEVSNLCRTGCGRMRCDSPPPNIVRSRDLRVGQARLSGRCVALWYLGFTRRQAAARTTAAVAVDRSGAAPATVQAAAATRWASCSAVHHRPRDGADLPAGTDRANAARYSATLAFSFRNSSSASDAAFVTHFCSSWMCLNPSFNCEHSKIAVMIVPGSGSRCRGPPSRGHRRKRIQRACYGAGLSGFGSDSGTSLAVLN